MAINELTFSDAAKNAGLDAVASLCAGGSLTIYSGVRPAKGGAETTALCTFTLKNPAAGAASGGVLTFTRPDDVIATATGTATWARIKNSGGTFVADMAVGATGSGAAVEINNTSIEQGRAVSCESAVITDPDPA
jgi:hypothetical protein